MKWLVMGLAVLVSGLVGCAPPPTKPTVNYATKYPQPAKPWRASEPASDGWQPDEQILNTGPDEVDKIQGRGPTRSRRGTAPSGLPYVVYEDGSGVVGKTSGYREPVRWSINCPIDAIDDKRKCNISSGVANLFIDYGARKSPASVCALDHDFPGLTAMIRVDKNAPLQTDKEGCVAASSILKQLRNGSEVTTRTVKWPYRGNVDKTASLQGLADALDLVEFIQTNMTKLSFRAVSAPE